MHMSASLPRKLPLSTVALIFGAASIPLAFLRHLCSLAVVLALLALLFTLYGRWAVKRTPARYSHGSIQRMHRGAQLALAGFLAGSVMWMLYAWRILP
jgi:hypothetical protein